MSHTNVQIISICSPFHKYLTQLFQVHNRFSKLKNNLELYLR